MLGADWFVGVDWAQDAHDVCVLDREGQVVERQKIPHTRAGLEAWIDGLLERAKGDPAHIAIGIEVPRGAIVEFAVERGFGVYSINPKQVDRFRDRFTVMGAKDDARDAHVIGDSLRTDPQAFRRVRLDDPLVIQLREWSRADEDLAVHLTRLTNQLRDLVYRVAPQLLTLCPAADQPWFWALLQVAPTPAQQRRLSRLRLERLLRTHRMRRLNAQMVRQVLQEPRLYTVPGVVDAVTSHIQLVLPHIELTASQRKEAAQTLERLLDALDTQGTLAGDQRKHSDVAIIRSMPGVGPRVAARVLAEASQPLAAREYRILRSWSGVAPVTKKSGSRRRPIVVMRHACNRRLRNAIHFWAANGTRRNASAKIYYHQLRDRGHRYGRALRSVADRFLRILVTLLRRGELFDPNHRQPTTPAVT